MVLIESGWEDWTHIVCLTQGVSDTVDCSIPEATEAIKPEEREELKVSGQYSSVISSGTLKCLKVVFPLLNGFLCTVFQ